MSPSASSSEHAARNRNPDRERSLSNPTPLHDFIKYINMERKQYIGRDGYNREQFFVPRCALERYWEKPADRVREVCESYSPNFFTPTWATIRDAYLRVFSTLVYAGVLAFFPHFLENEFTDEHFPLRDIPGIWADSPLHRDMFDKFREHQWTFFPVLLDRNKLLGTRLPDRRILPISSCEDIRTSDATVIYKVQFHESCITNFPGEGDMNIHKSYALKTYRGPEYRNQWDTEVRAFNALQGNDSNHVVKCYGAFTHGDTFNLILQWVDGPNLLDFLRKDQRPTCAADILDFWESLAKTLTGLHHLHQFAFKDDNPAKYQIVHQDIKLDNILLGPGTRKGRLDGGPFSFSPFIADFGCSHYSRIDSPAIDRGGNQMYSAPEAVQDAGSQWAGTSHLKWEADIFAMGAVLSDVATWVAFGQAGREEYLAQRIQESGTLRDIDRSGYEGTFHNGDGPKKCVKATHERIRNSLPAWDDITPHVLDVIDKYMLTATSRRHAKQLFYALNNEIHEIRKKQATPSPSSSLDFQECGSASVSQDPSTGPSSLTGMVNSPLSSNLQLCTSPDIMEESQLSCPPITLSHCPPIPAITETAARLGFDGLNTHSMSSPQDQILVQERPLSTPPPAHLSEQHLENAPCMSRSRSESGTRLSMQDTRAYWEAKKQKQPPDPSVEDIIDQLRINLYRRDHLFLIDDTATMGKHSDEILEKFKLLGYVAKGIDPDELELIFVSDPYTILKKKHTTPLVNRLKDHRYKAFPGAIENGLGTLINESIIPRLPIRIGGRLIRFRGSPKPMTIFVFTDGKWGPGVQLGNGLHEPILTLMNTVRHRQLNRTHVTLQFLRFGDDEEGKAHLQFLDEFGKEQGFDIVDTRAITDDVSSMFLASITRANDNDNIVAETALE